MAAYASSIDALRELLTPGHSLCAYGSCRVTNITQDIHCMTNGIEYCAVQVTCDSNIQYGIQAFGEEAIELHKEALRLSGKKIEELKERIPILYNAS
jgi:hypothetical protein